MKATSIPFGSPLFCEHSCVWLGCSICVNTAVVLTLPPPLITQLIQLDCSNRAKAVTLRPSGGPRIGAAVDTSTPSSPQDRPALDGSTGAAESFSPPVLGSVSSAAAGEEGTTEAEECFYYSFCPSDSHRFIALDSYDLHAIREELGPGEKGEDGEGDGKKNDNGDILDRRQVGMEVLSKHNPNKDKNDASGMDGLTKRYPLCLLHNS